jgi:plastocyanin
VLGAFALTLALSLAACGSSSKPASSSSSSTAAAPAASAASAAPHTAKITIQNFGFHPDDVTVAVGAKVTFTNEDQTAHTATATGMSFDTGSIQPGKSRTITITRAGVLKYFCEFHAFMRGQITAVK